VTCPVLTKREMYRRLVAGEFGNTLPRYFSLGEWHDSADYARYVLWGVQHASISAFPGTRLDVPRQDVAVVAHNGAFGMDYVISPMVHQVGRVQWEGDVYDHPERGLICSGNLDPAPGSWRKHMLAPRLWEGTAARVLLRQVLNANSYDDLESLVARFPGHVVEFSALDCCFGTHPGRNAVIWEVRRY
jgi:hypothetical protein